MSGKKKFFLDTAPIIYFLEDDKTFGLEISKRLEEIILNSDLLSISVLCYGEYLTIPYRNGDVLKEKNFYKFIRDLNIIVYDIDSEVMKIAARLRAKYKALKLPDAIQLATAIHNNCQVFLTNDKQLKQIKEIECIMIDGEM